jgi:hypothetical protein
MKGKKLLSLVLGTAMLTGVLAGCSKPATTTPETTKPAETKAETKAETTKPAEVVKLVYARGLDTTGASNDIIKAFNEKTNIVSRNLIRKFQYKSNEKQRVELAQVIIEENDVEKKAILLQIFKWVECLFPLDCEILITYASSDNDKLRNAALVALSNIKDDRVHDFAVKLLNENKDISDGIRILAKNYRKADRELLVSKVKSISINYDEENNWHNVFFSICDIFNEIKGKAAPEELLLYMYENTLCSFCRYYIVVEMSRRKILTEELLEKCLYDSYDDIREYASKRLKS